MRGRHGVQALSRNTSVTGTKPLCGSGFLAKDSKGRRGTSPTARRRLSLATPTAASTVEATQ